MKKVLSIIALSAMTLSLSSFNTHTTNQIVDQEEYGRASDCARMARATVLTLADAYDTDPNGAYFDYYIGMYHTLYSDCYNN